MTIKESPWVLEKQMKNKEIPKEMLRAKLQWDKSLEFFYQKKVKSALKKKKKKKKTPFL
jgi:hypothetical protein